MIRQRAMPFKELSILVKRWEGGDTIDTKLLIRELIKVFREVEAERRIEGVIG